MKGGLRLLPPPDDEQRIEEYLVELESDLRKGLKKILAEINGSEMDEAVLKAIANYLVQHFNEMKPWDQSEGNLESDLELGIRIIRTAGKANKIGDQLIQIASKADYCGDRVAAILALQFLGDDDLGKLFEDRLQKGPEQESSDLVREAIIEIILERRLSALKFLVDEIKPHI